MSPPPDRLGYGPWSYHVAGKLNPPPVTFGAGTWRVGIDIPAGLYRSTGSGSSYEPLSDVFVYATSHYGKGGARFPTAACTT